jgi:hypothetical protein
MQRCLWILLLLVVALLTGCGGGHSGRRIETDSRSIQIAWPERSRATLGAPSSALSAEITLVAADVNGADIVFVANRDASRTEAYTATYAIPTPVNRTATRLSVRFFAQANAQGPVVGVASANYTSLAENLDLANIVLEGKIESVAVADRTFALGDQPSQLDFSARDADGNVIAVTPGSAIWSVVSGSDVASVSADGVLTPMGLGTATVRATVDGVASNTATITVSSGFVRVFRFANRTDTIQLKGGAFDGAADLRGPFTVEAVMRPTSPDGFLWQQWANGSMNETIYFSGGALLGLATGSGKPERIVTSDAAAINAWNHVAWTYDGDTLRIYRNGSLKASLVVGANVAPIVAAQAAAIGKNAGVPFATPDVSFLGDLAAFRISNVARYTGATYTVPTGPWTVDGSTLALIDATSFNSQPTSFAVPGSQGLTATFGGGSASATSPTLQAYTP